MKHLAEHNDRFDYFVTVIDVSSKKVHVRVLKKKTATEVVDNPFGI